MDHEEKLARLCDQLGVGREAAQAALEQSADDLLDAALLLERGRAPELRRAGSYSTAQPPVQSLTSAPEPGEQLSAQLWQFFRGLLTHPLANALEIRTRERVVTTVPAVILLALFLVAFWITTGLLALGVLIGCRFTLVGPDWDIPAWNTILADLRGWLGNKLFRKGPVSRS